MVKTYLRYVPSSSFGVITSAGLTFDSTGELLITGAVENLTTWHIRRGVTVSQLKDGEAKSEVSELSLSPDNVSTAVGYSDGTVKIWNMVQKKCAITLNGHKSSISALRFNRSGALLVSGARDTNIIVWDVVNENGLYRLRGHKDMVTDCVFLEKGSKRLVSSSKDSFIKIWDLETQHCIQTLIGHRNEVWSFDVNPEETRLVAGSTDNKLRVWSLNKEEFSSLEDHKPADGNAEENGEEKAEEAPDEEPQAKFFGTIDRPGSHRVSRVRFNPKGTHLGCQTADTSIEFFEIGDKDQVAKKRRKRKQKETKKKEKAEKAEKEDGSEPPKMLPSDELYYKYSLVTGSKIKCFAFAPKSAQVAVSLSNNKLEVYSVEENSAESRPMSIELPGHRSDIRNLCLSPDDSLLLSGSNSAIKIWNTRTRVCIRTMSSGYGLCSAFLPGNRHVILGTKAGNLELYELSSATLMELNQAHTGAIWSLDMRPDKGGFVTGSADKEVKFWDLELVSDESAVGKRLTVVHTKTLKMSDDVLFVKYSPDAKLLAVSLLDSTVKVFHSQTLQFFLSLYGHKLPVLSFDISSDSTLMVTASADKNIKIWGLDFGDCHKSIFAHDDSITQVKFVHNTHYFFSTSKDKLLKYWDADKFQMIQSLDGHHGSVWSLCVSKNGDFVVTGSQDRSIRIWDRTEEPLFLEEERERALEAMFETEDIRDDQTSAESAPAGRRTVETIKAGERLMEAIDFGEEEKVKLDLYRIELASAEKKLTAKELEERKAKGKGPVVAPPAPNPLLMGLSPSKYVLKVLKEIRSSELEEALMVMTFTTVERFFNYLGDWIKEGKSVELACRCVFFLLKIHQNQVVANKTMLHNLDTLRRNTRKRLQDAKEIVGFNRAALNYMKRNIEMNTNTEFFDVSLELARQKKKAKQ